MSSNEDWRTDDTAQANRISSIHYLTTGGSKYRSTEAKKQRKTKKRKENVFKGGKLEGR